MNAENTPNAVQANAAVVAETNAGPQANDAAADLNVASQANDAAADLNAASQANDAAADLNAASQANAAAADTQADTIMGDTDTPAPHVPSASNPTHPPMPQQQQYGELPPLQRSRAPGSGRGSLTPAAREALNQSMWSTSRRNRVPSGRLRDSSMPSGIRPRQQNQGVTVQMGTVAPRDRQGTEVAFTYGMASFRLQASGEINPEDENFRPLHNEVRQINANTAAGSVQGRAASRHAFRQVTESVRNSDNVEFLVHVSRRREDRRLEYESQRRRRRHLEVSRGPSTRNRNRRRQAQLSQPAPASASFSARVEELSSEPLPPQVPFNNYCANCGRSDHVLLDCVEKWSPSGDIPGCYRCNTLRHTIDTCNQTPPYTDESRYHAEVVQRVGKPPLRSTQGWNKLAIQFGHDTPGPISRIRMQRVHPNHFRDWDYSRPASEQAHLLIQDPATENLQAVEVLPSQAYQQPGEEQQQYYQ
ncbi:hypothetical protein Hte_009633 [Hypoxylon texense]